MAGSKPPPIEGERLAGGTASRSVGANAILMDIYTAMWWSLGLTSEVLSPRPACGEAYRY